MSRLSHAVAVTITVRDATPADNDALVELCLACPMEGDIGLAIDRAPDFFVLSRLEGSACRVGIVESQDGQPVGCIAVAEQRLYVNGEPRPAMYLSDLRVHPAHRGCGAADALMLWARDACIAAQGPEAFAYGTVLAGNRSMVRRMEGRRGTPVMERVLAFRSHSIPILWRRRPPDDRALAVSGATADDGPEMGVLWSRLAPARQFATAHGAASLGSWSDAAPGLSLRDYHLARRPDGSLAGFLGVWDQSSFKRLRVTRYSRKLAAERVAFNAVAPLSAGTSLPPPGGVLRNITAVHVCVPPDEPAVLRSLLVSAYNASRARGYSFLNIGLDAADPLVAALKGLLAQPTDVWACVMTLGDPRPALDGRLGHYEVALM